jgi:Domain of unknown function (DUF4326)
MRGVEQGWNVMEGAMTTPKRIELRRAKGWRMPANAVKVDRSTKWGNPFIVGEDGMLKECADLSHWQQKPSTPDAWEYWVFPFTRRLPRVS